jgi:hypothetical protein
MLMHPSVIEYLTQFNGGSGIKDKIDCFVDNLSRPIRMKISKFDSEPLFNFINPSMKEALISALIMEHSPSTSMRKQLYCVLEQVNKDLVQYSRRRSV